MLDGGTETSASLIQSLVLCLIRSPAVLRKAQDEIDSVVGKHRFPELSDINGMPYVQAMIREVRPSFACLTVTDFGIHSYTV